MSEFSQQDNTLLRRDKERFCKAGIPAPREESGERHWLKFIMHVLQIEWESTKMALDFLFA